MSVAFWNARKKRKTNPQVCFELKDEDNLVFTLKNFKGSGVDKFENFNKLARNKFECKVSDLQAVVDVCDKYGWEVVPFPEETQAALDTVQNFTFNDEFTRTKIYKTMFPYQREGVRMAISRFNGRCLIGDEMGLGKTLQAISIYKYYRVVRLVVVCPAYLRYTWYYEFKKWVDDIEPIMVKKGSDSLHGGWPVIISYDLASKKIEELKKMNIDMIICDESHYLKSHTTKRTKALTPLVCESKKAIFLSGTPALNRPIELYSQAHMLYPKIFPSFRKYAVRYCDGQMSPLGFFDSSGSSCPYEMKWICRKMFMIRRLKRDVLTELPDKLRSEIYLDITPSATINKLMKQWKELNIQIRQMVPCSKEIQMASFKRKCLLSELYRETSLAKADIVSKVIADMANEGATFIVFCYHKDLMSKIEEQLSVPYMRIDGTTPTETRQQYVEDFQAGKYQVAVLSLLAASTGITLTRSSIVVFGELFWTPGVVLQAEDRCHRIGQKTAVDIKYLICRQTLDVHIFNMLKRKLSNLDNVLDGRDDRTIAGEQFEYTPDQSDFE
jgi:SWI/SNF-related matrix-associated actin-dependent regulator 1 of chromatin subfamily A